MKKCVYFLMLVASFVQVMIPVFANEPVDILKSWALSTQNISEAIYSTNGVHSNKGCDAPNNPCIGKRSEGDPSDPLYPSQWISDWTMFRVFQNVEKNPPPYTNPPATLSPKDYTVSFGTTYYDANYIPTDKEGKGAMLEHYNDYCLPIFPIKDNAYTCSFISLGNKAYFLTYDDRPKNMPPCCLFSPLNHPPRQDFIKHLDYSTRRSQQLNGSIQAYVWQTMLDEGGPLFGYAFNRQASPDVYSSSWYRHPQSFFFSGDTTKANAPIVSQNYTSFRAEKPQAAFTWDKVSQMCPKDNIPTCQLF
ncbi:hypothetical protein [Shewanella surugensis]|uniref:Uncharacterized protein n=1 Tax=Shewanella surugensis TaxID=212020 RepID=A0ABT0LGT0_9GAMM|nr:hypothetical protein [Shewanella surugensis]MCL1126907.1 hypothetical protein [Shewanella surugensis]